MSIGKDKNIEKYQNRVDSVRMSSFIAYRTSYPWQITRENSIMKSFFVSKKGAFQEKNTYLV